MPGDRERDGRKPPPRGPGQGKGKGPTPGKGSKPGGLRLRPSGPGEFDLDHPPCIHEMELDYAEGIELRRAGEPEEARDALRYALQGCGDNMWVHVALGRIALEDFNDPTLARGHFGYAFELGRKAMPPGFDGRLRRDRPMNAPWFDAADGLIACYAALGQAAQAAEVRAEVDRREARETPRR